MQGAIEVTGKIVINLKAREWCRLPYPKHPHGCPNYNLKPSACPPQVITISEWLRDTGRLWFVYVTFDLEHHAIVMHKKHPGWTDRQCRNLLYWQPAVNAKLRALAPVIADNLILIDNQGYRDTKYKITYCPEGMGVDVITTAKNAGLPITVKYPLTIVHKIALVAELKGDKNGNKK